MADELLPPKSKPPVPALFEQLGITGVKPSDKFKIEYQNGVMTGSVTRKSGPSETVTRRVGGGFKEYTTFDPSEMSIADRNELIRRRRREGFTQTKLAAMFGLSQSMIAKIVRD